MNQKWLATQNDPTLYQVFDPLKSISEPKRRVYIQVYIYIYIIVYMLCKSILIYLHIYIYGLHTKADADCSAHLYFCGSSPVVPKRCVCSSCPIYSYFMTINLSYWTKWSGYCPHPKWTKPKATIINPIGYRLSIGHFFISCVTTSFSFRNSETTGIFRCFLVIFIGYRYYNSYNHV